MANGRPSEETRGPRAREIEAEARSIAREVANADSAALEHQAKRRALDPSAPGDDSADATVAADDVVSGTGEQTTLARYDGLDREALAALLRSLADDVVAGQLVVRSEEDDDPLAVGRAIDVGIAVRRDAASRVRVTLELTWPRGG